MRRKVFSLMMMLLLAVTGFVRAEVVEIGDSASSGSYYYYPVNMYFHYSLTQQIFYAEEIGTAGTINSISFNYLYTGAFSMENVSVYMKNVSKTAFATSTDMEPLTEADLVYNGTFAATGSGWVTVELDTPFQYDGVSNLLVAFYDPTSGYPGSSYKFQTTTCDEYRACTYYSDSYTPDLSNINTFSGSKSYAKYRNNVRLDITAGGAGGGELTVNDGTATNSYVPVYGLYVDAYLKAEFVMPATDLSAMAGSDITKMTFYLSTPASASWGAANFQVFMKEVDNTTISAFVGPETAALVYEGALDGTQATMEVNFTAPYHYNGGNLLIGVYNTTVGTYKSASFSGVSATGAAVQGYSYSSLAAISPTQRNFLPKTTFTYSGSSVEPGIFAAEPIDLGYRPNGAWMRSYEAELIGVAVNEQVTAMESTNNYFGINVELPAMINSQNPIDFTIDHGTATAGTVDGNLVVMTGRGAYIIPMTATAYDPIANDVVETATTPITFTDGIFTAVVGENMYDNYLLPGDAEDGKDVVYKMNITGEKLFTAGVVGENGKWAVYTDFNGEPGPGVDNYYSGPEIGEGGTIGGAFNALIGDENSTTAAGYFPFYTLYNYSIAENLFLASELQEAGVNSQTMASLSWFANNETGYVQKGIKIWMANVSDAALTTTSHNTSSMTLVFDDNNAGVTPVAGWNEFVFNTGNNFSWDGHSNILICVQRNNGAWNSTVNWKTHEAGFNAFGYAYNDNSGYDMTSTTYPLTTSSTYATKRANVIFKSTGRGNNRETLTYNFDNSTMQGWTTIDGDGDGYNWMLGSSLMSTGYGHNASTDCVISQSYDNTYGALHPNNFLVSPQVTLGGSISFYACAQDNAWASEHFGVAVSTTNNTSASAFTTIQEWTMTAKGVGAPTNHTRNGGRAQGVWYQYTVDLSAYAGQTGYVAIRHFNCSDMFYLDVDDITIVEGGSGGGTTPEEPAGWEPGMPLTLLPGTYYLVASSTSDEFGVVATIEDLPLPVQAYNPTPADLATGIASPVTLRWTLGQYTTEYRVLFGTMYPPQEVIVDWTGNLAESINVGNLYNNKNYFWRVDERNSTGETLGQVWGFTTTLNIPQGFAAANQRIYEGDVAELSWQAVADRSRSMRGYNVYLDGVKVNTSLVTTTNFNYEGLTYNMDGYTFNVTAVYDEGESAFSEDVVVLVSGNGIVNGRVFEQDGETGIAGATVTFTGVDEHNRPQTYTFTTAANGSYEGNMKVGEYIGVASKTGYQDTFYGDAVVIVFNHTTHDINFSMFENWNPVAEVIAEEISDDLVKVYWSQTIMSEVVEDFETGDFTAYPWVNDATYPWEITSNNPYEGTYCMMSGNHNVASSTSAIQISMEIPYDGLMSFFGKISSESSWDYGYFYIDGVEKASFTGAGSWVEKEFPITEGTHTFKWAYTKDGSVNSNDDRFYVDYVSFYHHAEPTPPGTTVYDFEDSSMQGWTNIDADGDGYKWEVASNVMSTGYGHNGSNDCVLSQSYYSGVVLYPDNYLVSPQVTLGGSFSFYACAQDAAYAAEHFGVAVSTSGNTSASDFTTIQEWTMTSKEVGAPTEFSRSGNRVQGNWYQFTVDLSSYAGQTGYVAIRHFNCSDMFYLDVDDISLVNGGAKMALASAESVYTRPVSVNRYRSHAAHYNNRSFNHYNVYRAMCNVPEEAELIAEVIDTVYMDVAWANLEPGVYMWGVSRVYEGNRESQINWVKPTTVEPTADATVSTPKAELSGRAAWDLLGSFECTSGYQYGVATDGNYIYTSSWSASSTSQFYKYTMDGTFVEEFNVSGSGQIRDLTYDGQYFYGVANASTIYCLDLANHTLVSTITSAYGAQRCCSYDPVRDGFWVVGNWSGNLTLVDRTGAIVITGPAPESASGVAYYKDAENVEHVLCFNNGNNQVYDYNIANNTIATAALFDFCNSPLYTSGTVGGCHVGNYNGKVAFFGDLQQSPNAITIYELHENSTPVPPTPPTPVGGEGESEIVWSNCIDHNMYQQVSLFVTTNSGDEVTGAEVTLVNLSEPELGLVYTTILDESGIYVWDEFRRGEYQITITLDGFADVNEVVDLYTNNTLAYELEEIVGNLDNLYVSATGWVIMGEVTPGGGGPVGPTGPGTNFTEGFESGMPAGWTVVDGNNDGWTWCLTSAIPSTWTYYASLTLDWYHSGTNAICSGSYINGVGALTPNEYLITDQVVLTSASELSFWVAATDASYPADHFGVFVSTTGTNPSDFTSVQEWTLTGKKEGLAGGAASRNGNGLRLGTWYNYTVNLGAYAGNAYIAFRHFNCNDQYIMCLDDITLTSGATDRNVQQYLVRLNGALDGTTSYPFFQHNTDNLVAGETYTTSVKAIYGTGESDWADFEWVYTPCDFYEGLQEEPIAEWVDDDVVLSWVLPEGSGPIVPPTGNTTFSTGFEGGMPEGWTVIDGNNDGYTWCLTSAIPSTWTYYASLTLDWYHTGTNAICSGSYINGVGALTPNEYLITNQVSLVNGSELSFWVAATDASYPADHFGVFVSTTGTNPDDFTSVQEWTLTGKKEGLAGGAASRNGNGLRLGTWYNYTVDLSSFAGTNAYIAFRHFNCNDQYIMCLDDIELTAPAKGRAMWDRLASFSCTSAYQYGVATDGVNIYTCTWSSSADNMFYKYDMDGNFIESFNISGCGYIRDLTYDGQYFYGGANANTLYCVDLANKTLVGSTSSSATIRHCSYDPENDGFWVGEWSNLKLIDRNGAVQFTAAAPSSASGSGYFTDDSGNAHLLLFCQPSSDAKVYDYDIATNTIYSSPIFDFATTPGYDAGISGGAFVGEYNGKVAFFGDAQQSPNLVGIYELGEGSGPVPPVPPVGGGIIGVEIFRDGEWIAEVPYPAETYTDVNPGLVDEYEIRVVHDGYVEDWTYYTMSCPEIAVPGGYVQVCDAPENLVGDYLWTEENYGAILGWTYGEEPVTPAEFQWYYYDNGINDDAIGTGGGEFWWGVMFPAGSYEGGQVAKVAAYDYMAMSGDVTIYNDGTNAPANAVGSTSVTFNGSEDFVEFQFSTPVNIDPTKNVWVVFHNASGATYPAAVCPNTGDANGRWVSLDGATWEDLASYGLDYTFMIRAYIGGAKGEVTVLGTTPEPIMTSGSFSNAGQGFGPAASAAAIDNVMAGDPIYFNVYRDGDVIATVPFTGEYEYVYYDVVEAGIYDYQVTAVYEDGCESDFALTPMLDQDYVTVDVTSVEEIHNLAIYPNPTTGNVTIEAAGMNHITVVSVLGQVVYDADITADMTTLSLGQFKAGVYMVRVNTENGVKVSRVTVVK